MRDDQRKRTLIVAPHPDDDVLACGGTIAHKVAQGGDVFILYMTDGRNSHSHALGIQDKPSPEEVRQVRRQEAIKAASIMGVPEKNLFFLDFEDGFLGNHTDGAIQRVQQLLAKINASQIYFPLARDGHPDHQATNAIITAVLNTTKTEPPSLYQYAVWTDPARQTQKHPLQTFKQDVRDMLVTKRRALAQHRSQIQLLWPSQNSAVLSAAFLERFLSGEEEFELTPASGVAAGPGPPGT